MPRSHQDHLSISGLRSAKEPPPTYRSTVLAAKELLRSKEKNPRTFQLLKGNPNVDNGVFQNLFYVVIPNSILKISENFQVIMSYDIDATGSRTQIATPCKKVVNLAIMRGLSVLDFAGSTTQNGSAVL